jgi:hypothetical protein
MPDVSSSGPDFLEVLKEAIVKTLSTHEVHFDFMLQFQTDAYRMPVENASVVWPKKLSPFIPVARLRLPVTLWFLTAP